MLCNCACWILMYGGTTNGLHSSWYEEFCWARLFWAQPLLTLVLLLLVQVSCSICVPTWSITYLEMFWPCVELQQRFLSVLKDASEKPGDGVGVQKTPKKTSATSQTFWELWCVILFDFMLQLSVRIEGIELKYLNSCVNEHLVIPQNCDEEFSSNTRLSIRKSSLCVCVCVPRDSWTSDLVCVSISEWVSLAVLMAEFNSAEVVLEQNVWQADAVCVYLPSTMCHHRWRLRRHQAEVSNSWWGRVFLRPSTPSSTKWYLLHLSVLCVSQEQHIIWKKWEYYFQSPVVRVTTVYCLAEFLLGA